MSSLSITSNQVHYTDLDIASSSSRGRRDDYFLATFSDSTRLPSDETQWESLLDRGLAYGIKTKERLCQEADVGDMSHIGNRLTDDPRYRHDIDLWEILLIAQALRNGHEGIKAIWRGMKFRGEAVRLEGDDPRVDALWGTFLSAGAEDHQFLWSICKEAKLLVYKRPRLFAEIVGAALEGRNPLEASQFASFIGEKHYRGREDMLAIFSAACQSRNPDALKAFCRIYDMIPTDRIYAEITSALWEQDRSADAFMMHSFLILRRDLPRRFELLEPFVNYLALHNESLDKFLSPLYTAGVSFEAQARRLWSIGRSRVSGVPADSLNIVASKTMGANPSKLSDHFVARAFATRAFSFDFAVQSLRMIGLIEVGPLAVRQLATSSPDLETLQSRFHKLRELEIDTGGSVFVRVLKNVCDAGHWEMAQALVDNDLHHEVFEDPGLQKRLLTQYYRKQDWRQLNRTLAVLNDGHFDEAARRRSASLVLRAMVSTSHWRAVDWGAVMNGITALQEHGWRIAPGSSRAIAAFLACHPSIQQPTHARKEEDVDHTALLIGIMQTILASGTDVQLKYWRRAYRALGRQGRLVELESLLYWIAEWFKAEGLNENVRNVPFRSSGSSSVLSAHFDDHFQKSLMSWCFRPRKGMRKVSPERCLRWTRILKRLRDAYGVEVKEYVVRWEFIRRLRRLFAPGMQLKRPGTLMRARNVVSITRFWALYDKMWDMKPASRVKYDDRIKICLCHRKLSPLKRRHLLNLLERSRAARTPTLPLPDEHRPNSAPGDIVVYRDLFNASWEDYRT
ncbi:hypothetical protein H2200_006810 [Cladophialophora chaetospira]|uniref:Pentatricopeptide repeat domain-containing protein n=1 Tax=Cladophialophora chaetospira TaxID=386627 RepID=A0AA38X9H4_9EURO|nr:hypothetical protein H2200_006810 [Cladophialophora chaetospira]